MKKTNKKELIKHLKNIEKKFSEICTYLEENNQLSMFKITMCMAEVEYLISDSQKALHDVIVLKKNYNIILIIIIFFCTIFNMLAVPLTFTNIKLGVILMLISTFVSLSAIKEIIKKNIKKEFSQDFIKKFESEIINCQVLLDRHLENYKTVDKTINVYEEDKEYIYNRANILIAYYLNHPEIVLDCSEIETDVFNMMIIILQNELNTDENSLDNLISSARAIKAKNPFFAEEAKDVLVLTRKNKKSN